MAAGTWNDRDLPVLRAIVEHFDNPKAGPLRWPDVADLSGVDVETAERALWALRRAEPPYIEGQTVDQEAAPIMVYGVTERAMVVAGQWPSPEAAVDELVATLAEAAEAEPDEDKRSKLKAAAQALGSVGRDIAIGWATGMIPHL